MEIYRDFKELLESFNAHGVEYLVVGGHALATIAILGTRAIASEHAAARPSK
jgi:hypothetical protein